MNVEALKRAQRALQIHDVCLRDTKTHINDVYDPLFPHIPELEVEYRHTPHSEVAMADMTNDATGEKLKVMKVAYDFAVRMIEPQGAEDIGEPKVVALVESTFLAYYKVTEEVSSDEVSIFVGRNVPFHIWPYWREYLSSTLSRLRLPPVVLPYFMLPPLPKQPKAGI